MTADIAKRDWRELARQGNWRDLRHEDYQGLGAADRAELIAELKRYVPKYTVGHGLERREVYLHPRKAQDVSLDQSVAAFALFKLQREADRERDPKERILGEAIELAKQVLHTELGVHEYRGLLSTYLQKLPDGSFKQIEISGVADPDDFGRPRIYLKKEATEFDELQMSYVLGMVNVAYGSKSRQTLAGFWKLGSFELNSPADHAVSILDAELRIDVLASQPPELESVDSKVGSRAWDLVESAFEIGRHFDALTKKKVESLAQQKLQHIEKNRTNASLGGQAKKGKLRREELDRLATADNNFCMKRFEGVAEVLMFIETKQAIARAMKLAERFDNTRSPEDKLFSLRGKPLSRKWYVDWWDDFRSRQKIS